MKKFLLIIFISYSSLQIAYSQSGWSWLNPLPQGDSLNSVQFVDANTAFACGTMGTILKTNNGGQNWSVVYYDTIRQLVSVSFINSQTGFACSSYGLTLVTTNSGSSWSVHNTSYNAPFKTIHFINSQTGFAVINRNFTLLPVLLRTTNAGLNWYNQLSTDLSYTYITGFSFPNNSTGFAVGNKLIGAAVKLLKTTNSGITWDSIPQSIQTVPSSIFFLNATTGFFSIRNELTTFYKTVNGGYNWPQINTDTIIDNLTFINENTGFSLTNSIFQKTTNGGLNWHSNLLFLDAYSVIGNSIIGVGAGLILKSTNIGNNWNEITTGNHYEMENISFINNNTGIHYGNNSIYKTTNGGIKWNNLLTGGIHYNDFYASKIIDELNWYIADWETQIILKTTNGGASWDSTFPGVYAVTALDFVNVNTGFGVCKHYNFIKTTNGGLNWQVIPWSDGNELWSVDFLDENTGFVGGSRLYKTSNAGSNWTQVNLNPYFYSGKIQFLNYSTGYINSYSGIFKTTDGGNNWLSVLAVYPTNDMSFLNVEKGFVLGNGKLYKTSNGGITWIFNNVYSDNTKFLSFTDSLTGYCGGNNGSILKTTTGGEPIGIQPISNEVPNSFVLHQNYPNPFNPVTKIKFSLPNPSEGGAMKTKLIIYDITGREVATLLNEQLQPGTYEVTWDGTNYASGVYFYQLIANTPRPDKSGHPSQEGTYVQTKKMVLLK